MRRRSLRLTVLLVTACAWIALGNDPPTMEDRYVTTVEEAPVTFEVRAQDEDLDPLHPEAHALRFQLLSGPKHGVILGDLSDTRYEGPHDAVIELTYAPAAGFVGTDVIKLAVLDPSDETAAGTVTVQVVVTARRMEGLLSGSWSMNATFLPQVGAFTAFRSKLTEVYRVGAVTMKGIARLRKTNVRGGDRGVRVAAVRRGPRCRDGDAGVDARV